MMYSKLDNLPMLTLLKHQFEFKLKANAHLFHNLILIQAIILIVSIGGLGGGMYGSSLVTINHHLYSTALLLLAAGAFILSIAVSMSSHDSRNMDFSFVSSRLTSNLFNALLLLVFSIYAAVVVTLAGFSLRVIAYYTHNDPMMLRTGFYLPLNRMFMGLAATALYLFLFGALVCFICNLFEFSKLTLLVFPFLLVLVLLFLRQIPSANSAAIARATAAFLFKEASFAMFFIKTVSLSAILLACGSLVTNRIDVKR